MQSINEKIKQRRRQMLVHSFLYYEMDTNIIDDSTWSKWGVELAKLQNENPDIASKVEYAEQFKDWDGSSGAHLVYDDTIKSIAYKLYCKQWGLKPQIVKSNNIIPKIAQKMQKPELKSTKPIKTTATRLF